MTLRRARRATSTKNPSDARPNGSGIVASPGPSNVPFHVPSASVHQLEALPGIGKKRAVALKVKRPRSVAEVAAIVDDPKVMATLAPHLRF